MNTRQRVCVLYWIHSYKYPSLTGSNKVGAFL
jgi:hypothetical protein